MRVLTHPQHAGKPMPAKKPKAAKAPPAAKPAPAPMRAAPKPMAAASQSNGSASAVAIADKPRMPGAPSRPVEVFSPDRPDRSAQPAKAHGDAIHLDEDDTPLGTGSLLDDMDDSSLGLIHPEPKTDAKTGSKPQATPETKAIEKTPEPAEPEGPQIGDVVDLIEKLRTHVDAQNGRFEQAMGVLDQIRTSAAALPEIRERIDTMLASIDELKASQFRGHEKVERALAAQSSRLDEIARAIERATQREERLAQSLIEINQTILAVSTTNDRLASAIDAMRRHEAERDARIGRALTGAQRWLIVLTLVMAVGMIATIITAVVAGG
ncbi:MAG: hypothetical protein ACIAQU_10620 [Phycisphaerales bacterium JB064]